MSDQNNPVDVFGNPQNSNTNVLRSFSDELITKFKGKIVELYIGDQYETLNFEDFSMPQNCTIYGRLIDLLDRFVILDCFYVDPATKQVKSGNQIYINTFQIRAMTEVNGRGSLNDIFLSTSDAIKVRKLANAMALKEKQEYDR